MLHRERFIIAHTRLATSVGLQNGYRFKCGDELIGIALAELCKFPEFVANGGLNDNEVLRCLLSKLHYACIHNRENDRLFGPSKNCPHKIERVELVDEHSTVDRFVTDHSDFVNDLYKCVQTEQQRIVLNYLLAGHNISDIVDKLGLTSPLNINTAMEDLYKRYRALVLDRSIQIWLPFPSFELNAKRLAPSEKQLNLTTIEQLLAGKLFHHPLSEMWRYNKWQLVNYCLYLCPDNDRLKYLKLRDKYEYQSHDLPTWFAIDTVFVSHRGNLLRINNAYYRKFGWAESPSSDIYWPA